MSTANTPAPGSPEWLRDEANHCECRGDPQEIPNGLRAAAERIQELEIAEQFGEAALGHLRDEIDRLRAENDQLKGALALGQHNCDEAYNDLARERDVAKAKKHLTDEENVRVRAENEALKNALGRVYLALGTDEVDHTKWPQQIEALRARMNWLRSKWVKLNDDPPVYNWDASPANMVDLDAAIDAAREEGA